MGNWVRGCLAQRAVPARRITAWWNSGVGDDKPSLRAAILGSGFLRQTPTASQTYGEFDSVWGDCRGS